MTPLAASAMTDPDVCPHEIPRPVMLQRWEETTFLHWPYDPEEVRRHLPMGFEPDTFDGAAWVALVPFRMVALRPPGLPALPWVSHFAEINVRSYVKGPDGVPGVWFSSLEVPRLGAAVVARTTYRLPYCWAKVRWDRNGDDLHVTTRRRWPGAGPASRMRVRIGTRLTEPDPFATWATARWGLVAPGPRWAAVHHEPWPLHHATVVDLDDDLVEAAGFSAPQGAPRALHSPAVDVRVTRPRKVRR
jgi:uncharacterized protein